MKTKIIYEILMKDILIKTNAISVWEMECNCHFDEQKIWLLAKKITPETKLHAFHWKFIIRRIPNALKLFQWKKTESPLCDACQECDTYKHRYWNCIVAQNIWKYIENVLERLLGYKFSLNFRIMVGGVDIKKKIDKLVNLIILIGKWAIHKYNTCNLKDTFSSTIVIRNELFQRA